MNATTHPEFASVDALAEELADDERDSFTAAELDALCQVARLSNVRETIRALEAYGFRYEGRPVVREVRGFKAKNHDRFSAKNGWAGGTCYNVDGIQGFAPAKYAEGR